MERKVKDENSLLSGEWEMEGWRKAGDLAKEKMTKGQNGKEKDKREAGDWG